MHKQDLIPLIRTIFPNPIWRQIVATIVIIWCLLVLTLSGLNVFDVRIAEGVMYMAGFTLFGRGLKSVFEHEKTASHGGSFKNK